MNVGCSIKKVIDIERPGQGIRDLKNAGFQSVFFDLSVAFAKNSNGQLDRDRTEKYFNDNIPTLFSKINECGMSVDVMKAPYIEQRLRKKVTPDYLKELALKSVEIGVRSHCKFLVILPFDTDSSNSVYDYNKNVMLDAVEHLVGTNTMILVENRYKNINGHFVRGFCSDETEAVGFIDELNRIADDQYGKRIENGEYLPYFGFCMNVGTCNLCAQNMYDFAVTLGKRIKAVVLRDCNGSQDTSMLPFTSVNDMAPQTDWLNLTRGLRAVHFDGELLMDFADTASAFSPILKPQVMSLAKAIADYFKWQIEIERLLDKYPSRVLFGAGNMCRNYMKNYGEKYPPLFTCDNNKNVWGQTFEGLEIKNPESLKELPDDTAIFICNIYYREIEEQLRSMGLNNPVEYFNDEYMPSFHFKRIDAVTRKLDKEEN